MARWSDAMKFDIGSLHAFKSYLDSPGVYELGYVRGQDFIPKYVGKAGNQTLYVRLRQYFYESSASKIPPQLLNQIAVDSRRNMMWFHVFRTDNPEQVEARLLGRYGIQDEGAYEWNRRYEKIL